MPFTPKTDWQDSPSVSTPITAAELIRMENGIAEGARDGTESVRGNLELASAAEMTAGTDLARVPSVKRVADYVASALSGLSFATESYVQTAIAAPRLIVATATSMVPLTVKGIASQTANLFEAKTSADVQVAAIDPNGQITAGGAFSSSAMLKTKCRTATTPGARIQAASAQSANLLILEDSTGTNKMTVAPDGTVNGPNVGTIPGTSITFAPALVLDANEAVPAGTPDGTVILRRPA